jgi:NDP-sugar pyrophosphorylase family protein
MEGSLREVTAAILVGGRGTRLQSSVSDRPKALAAILGRPYLCYLLDFLSAAGVRDVVLLTGYRAEQIETLFGNSYAALRLTYSREATALGTAGAVRLALPQLQTSTILVLNGDSYWSVSLPDFWAFHTRHGSDITLGLTWVPDTTRFGRVHAEGGRVTGYTEKGQQSGPGWINAGFYFFARKRLEEIPADVPVSLEQEMFPRWVQAGSCFGFQSAGPFLDIGTPESYAQAAEFFHRQSAA